MYTALLFVDRRLVIWHIQMERLEACDAKHSIVERRLVICQLQMERLEACDLKLGV